MVTETVFPMIEVRVSDQPLLVEEVQGKLIHSGWGAEILFLGNVRDWNLGRPVVAVSYDAFAPHAEATLRTICEEASREWGPKLGMIVHHRTGRLSVGEASVIIGVASVHRDEAYEASRYIIEQLKERAAIWKKEHYEDGESEWLKGHALCSHAEERIERGAQTDKAESAGSA